MLANKAGLRSSLHPAILIMPSVVLIGGVIASILYFDLAIIGITLLAGLIFLRQFFRFKTLKFNLSDTSVVVSYGWLTRIRQEFAYEHISQITLKKYFGSQSVGSIKLYCYGYPQITLRWLKDPGKLFDISDDNFFRG